MVPKRGDATHAAVVSNQVQPDKIAEPVSNAPDRLSTFSQPPGCKGGLYLIDPNTGKHLAIGLWETEAHMSAFVSGGSQQERRTQIAHLMAGWSTRETYEVSLWV